MKLKKALRKYGGVVGNLATGNIKGAFPVIDFFNSATTFSGLVNDDVNKRPKV